tara:strand:- start:30857 stop:31264 length:408 start_codon:yes stop_codon:yes gene_type:complete
MVKWRTKTKNQAGWTLVELTIVMSLIVVFSTLALVGYSSAITRSKEAVLKENLFRMREAIDQYYVDRQRHPVTLESLVTEGYLRTVPVEPFTGSTETWQAISGEFNAVDPFSEGVFDVKTRHDGTALDGTLYVDW